MVLKLKPDECYDEIKMVSGNITEFVGPRISYKSVHAHILPFQICYGHIGDILKHGAGRQSTSLFTDSNGSLMCTQPNTVLYTI